MTNLFQQTLQRRNESGTPPIWLMRQAGRYHAHYQNLRKQYGFLELCRNAEVSAEAAMGPIEDFDFDAAILFSDILFPLEAMGISLDFDPAPRLGRLLKTVDDLAQYHPTTDPKGFFGFQADALHALRRRLPASKGMIGFVGGALTLYQFACEGTGKKHSRIDARFAGFMEKLLPLLLEQMVVQAEAGIDCMAILDSSAGILLESDFKQHYLPYLARLLKEFQQRCPNTPVLYYSKGTHRTLWKMLEGLPLQGIGIDHHNPLAASLSEFSTTYAIQGNIPPEWMNLPWSEAEPLIRTVFAEVLTLSADQRKGWICGLGHGMQPIGQEESVRGFVRLVREMFVPN
jgi:uroporphyrinogen decarboxylase